MIKKAINQYCITDDFINNAIRKCHFNRLSLRRNYKLTMKLDQLELF